MQSLLQQPVLLSCKLTNAVLKFLERRGEDLEPLYERFDWPLYYLRDSSSWLEADRLEFVLKTLDEIYGPRVFNETGADFFSAVGHASPQLRAWGALDSVLKIVRNVRDLYQQPDRFLASFISPQPQIYGLQHSDENVVFRIGFSDDRMPHTARFLRAILESLPEFIGKPRAHVMWNHGNVSIEWSERQVPFVTQVRNNDNEMPSLSPDLLRTILVDLTTAQRELENARRVIQDKDATIQSLQAAAQAAPVAPPSLTATTTYSTTTVSTTTLSTTASVGGTQPPAVTGADVEKALHEIYKLGDYFARAQQIVTLLRAPATAAGTKLRSGVTLASSQSEALIKRTAWERVSAEAPVAIRRASMYLRGEADDVAAEVAMEAAALASEGGVEGEMRDVTGTEENVGTPAKGSFKKKSATPSFFDQHES